MIDDNTRETIRSLVSRGINSPESIALQTNVDVRIVEEVLAEIRGGVTPDGAPNNVDLLRRNLRLLQSLLETAEWEYRALPTLDNASAVTSMVGASIATIKEIESRKDPADMFNEVLANVVQPLLRAFVKNTTVSANRVRQQLCDALPSELHGRVDQELKDLVKILGRQMSDDYRRSVELLAKSVGCKPEDQKVRPLLRPVAEDSDEPTGT
jgi:hypothetical protein